MARNVLSRVGIKPCRFAFQVAAARFGVGIGHYEVFRRHKAGDKIVARFGLNKDMFLAAHFYF